MAAVHLAWPWLRRDGAAAPQIALMNAECRRVVAMEPRTATEGLVVVVEVQNVGNTPIKPGLVFTALEPAAERGQSLLMPQGRSVGARSLTSSLTQGGFASIVIRIDSAGEDCDGRIQVVGAGASTTVQRASVNPSLYVEDFDALSPVALVALENQVGARATWHTAEGNLEARSGGGALFSPTDWEDYDAEVSLMFPDGVDNDAAIVFRAKDALNWYQMRIDSTRARLIAFVEGRLRTVASAEFADARGGRWHRLKVEVRGTRVKGYVDGALVLQFDGLQLASGAVGVMQDEVRVRYDDLVVRPLVAVARRR